VLTPAISDPCPCGADRPFGTCCGPLLTGTPAVTAEGLMRSRYTAHVLGYGAYLSRTRCPTAAAPDGMDDGALPDPDIHWLDLRILRTDRGGPKDRDGMVEFVARYKRHGRAGRLHEVSRFVRAGEGWCYLAGTPGEPPTKTRARRRR
jgi:SEC-C motif-containing protein